MVLEDEKRTEEIITEGATFVDKHMIWFMVVVIILLVLIILVDKSRTNECIAFYEDYLKNCVCSGMSVYP